MIFVVFFLHFNCLTKFTFEEMAFDFEITLCIWYWNRPLLLILTSPFAIDIDITLWIWYWNHPLHLILTSPFAFYADVTLCIWYWNHPLHLILKSPFVFDIEITLCIWYCRHPLHFQPHPMLSRLYNSAHVDEMIFQSSAMPSTAPLSLWPSTLP